jgi:HSP20 family protein
MRGDPADLALRNLQRLVERDPILRDIVNPNLPTARRAARFVPPVDVIERPDAYVIVMELAGIPRDAVRIRLDGSRLTVSGEKPPRPEKSVTRVSERETGPFSREFLIPFQVRAEGIAAKLEDGVLTIELPRSGLDRARDVPIT